MVTGLQVFEQLDRFGVVLVIRVAGNGLQFASGFVRFPGHEAGQCQIVGGFFGQLETFPPGKLAEDPLGLVRFFLCEKGLSEIEPVDGLVRRQGPQGGFGGGIILAVVSDVGRGAGVVRSPRVFVSGASDARDQAIPPKVASTAM